MKIGSLRFRILIIHISYIKDIDLFYLKKISYNFKVYLIDSFLKVFEKHLY